MRTRWTTTQPDFGSFCALVDHIPRSSHRQVRDDCAVVPAAACIYTRTGGYGEGHCSRAPPPPPPPVATTVATTTRHGGGGGGYGGGDRDGGGGGHGQRPTTTTMMSTTAAAVPLGPEPTSYSTCYVRRKPHRALSCALLRLAPAWRLPPYPSSSPHPHLLFSSPYMQRPYGHARG